MTVYKQKNVLMDSLDTLAVSDFMRSKTERVQLAKQVVNTLADYPFITAKMRSRQILAQFKVSCARNALRSYVYGIMGYNDAVLSATADLECAFSLLSK